MSVPANVQPWLPLGVHHFPLKERGKLPLTAHGVLDATTSPEQISSWAARWPRCNWGRAAGASGELVVDLDGPEGLDAWNQLEADHDTPETLMARTGSGGYHLVFLDPDQQGVNSTRRLGSGIDTRGRGGYIVAAGSTHPCGGQYEWVNEASRALCPEWILQRINPPKVRRPAASTEYQGTATVYGQKTLEGILRALGSAQEGNKHDLNFWAALRAGQLHAAGHVGSEAHRQVLDTAHSVRIAHDRAEIDTRDGWQRGVADNTIYPLAGTEPKRSPSPFTRRNPFTGSSYA